MKFFGKLRFLLLIFLALGGTAQNFKVEDLRQDKTYILLAHPTAQNLETIHFLLTNKLLQPGDVDFVGVYSSAEKYDYTEAAQLIVGQNLQKFHLLKVDGSVDTSKVFTTNSWSPVFKQLFDRSVGIFFFGGPDIQPEIYHQQNVYSAVTDPNRHLFELSFLFHLLGGKQNESFNCFLKERPDYFVTGFCLGLQSMNVATGGTLVQDIPAQKYEKMNAEETLQLKRDQLHRNYWPELSDDTLLMGINFHRIQFTAHPFFLKKVKADKDFLPLVFSSHHQAIDELGKDLLVTATSMDNEVIEGIQHRIYPNVFAVQFHPEVPELYLEGKKLKFNPTDEPKSYFEIIGEQGREFHRKYWLTISKAIQASIKAQK